MLKAKIQLLQTLETAKICINQLSWLVAAQPGRCHSRGVLQSTRALKPEPPTQADSEGEQSSS